jgi:hypothetical protein
MTAASSAVIELRDLPLNTDIGTYGPSDVVPDEHLLDLTLGIAVEQLLIDHDGMENVFDYTPPFLLVAQHTNRITSQQKGGCLCCELDCCGSRLGAGV